MKREELEKLSQEELDEAVLEAKTAEAADINNSGRDAQIQYLLENDDPRWEQLRELTVEFHAAGGRGIELAELIDELRHELGINTDEEYDR
jgi:hypothetical protein